MSPDGFFLLNIESILCVTIKPPKIFTEAKTIAKKPTSDAKKFGSLGPAAISAPTIITLEIAFVTPIRGECKAGVTDHTTKYPIKHDKINTVIPNTRGSTEPWPKLITEESLSPRSDASVANASNFVDSNLVANSFKLLLIDLACSTKPFDKLLFIYGKYYLQKNLF